MEVITILGDTIGGIISGGNEWHKYEYEIGVSLTIYVLRYPQKKPRFLTPIGDH